MFKMEGGEGFVVFNGPDEQFISGRAMDHTHRLFHHGGVLRDQVVQGLPHPAQVQVENTALLSFFLLCMLS